VSRSNRSMAHARLKVTKEDANDVQESDRNVTCLNLAGEIL